MCDLTHTHTYSTLIYTTNLSAWFAVTKMEVITKWMERSIVLDVNHDFPQQIFEKPLNLSR